MPSPIEDEGVDFTNFSDVDTPKPADTERVKIQTPVAVTENHNIELPPITFLYGTQTGTSQDYADQLSKQAKGFGFKDVTLCQMDKWNVLKDGKYSGPKDKLGLRHLLVVVTATYK